MCSLKNDYSKGIRISIWTVVQTIFHVIWTAIGYNFYWCKIKPTNYLVFLVHLTYFYDHSCGDIIIENDYDTFFTNNTTRKLLPLGSNVTDEEDNLQDIVYTIFEKGVFPKESVAARRTQIYIMIYIVSDGIWVITAFLLLAGIYFETKRCLSLLFYIPWLALTTFISFLDVIAAVNFGLDLLQIQNYTTWLKFVGVRNYNDFTKFNDYYSSKYIPQAPSIVMILLFSRIFFLWMLNIANFFHIMNIAALAYQDVPRNVQGSRAKYHSDLDTSESRIRNWMNFYGDIENPTTVLSENAVESFEMKPNTRNRINSTPGPVAGSSHSFGSTNSNIGRVSSFINSPSVAIDVSSKYRRYSDVADCIPSRNSRKDSIDSLRGQKPWTYLPSEKEGGTCESKVGSGIIRNRQELLRSNSKSTAF
nr:uncharacterized protein LOC111516303 [Leptinotarsa decemlineata]